VPIILLQSYYCNHTTRCSSLSSYCSFPLLVLLQFARKVVWTVGLRGLWDYTYCGHEGKQRCGDEITSAMANQTKWIREVQPEADIVTCKLTGPCTIG
jgi:hypothetical protein